MRLQHRRYMSLVLAAGLGCSSMLACQNLPYYGEGTPEDRARQGAVLGGIGGAVLGATSSENPLLGALLGGALGAGGGYLIGANMDALRDVGSGDGEGAQASAQEAVERARRNPATPEDVRRSRTADLNNDGFVTTDELIAMERAGLSDEEMLARLEATGQIFELTAAQERRLRAAGLSAYVVAEMQQLHRAERQRLLSEIDVLGR